MQTDTELVAGRELDALVAEKVMGWESYSGGHYYGKNGHILVCLPGELDGSRPPWSPSTDIAAAWQVVEKWRGDFTLRRQNGYWKACFYEPSMQHENLAETAPLAICRAALAATT